MQTQKDPGIPMIGIQRRKETKLSQIAGKHVSRRGSDGKRNHACEGLIISMGGNKINMPATNRTQEVILDIQFPHVLNPWSLVIDKGAESASQ